MDFFAPNALIIRLAAGYGYMVAAGLLDFIWSLARILPIDDVVGVVASLVVFESVQTPPKRSQLFLIRVAVHLPCPVTGFILFLYRLIWKVFQQLLVGVISVEGLGRIEKVDEVSRRGPSMVG